MDRSGRKGRPPPLFSSVYSASSARKLTNRDGVTIESWLEGIKTGYKRFTEVFTSLGLEDLDDVVYMAGTMLAGELRQKLEAAGALPVNVRRILNAVAQTIDSGGQLATWLDTK